MSSLAQKTTVSVLGGSAEVYPIGLRHFDQFRRVITSIASLWSKISEAIVYVRDPETGKEVVSVKDPEVLRQALASEFIGSAFGPLIEVIDQCTKFVGVSPDVKSIEDLPHWEAPKIIGAWIEVSFFPIAEKFLPWMELFRSTLESIGPSGERGDSTTPSESSSGPGSPSNPS